jgi:hypothetical protein
VEGPAAFQRLDVRWLPGGCRHILSFLPMAKF